MFDPCADPRNAGVTALLTGGQWFAFLSLALDVYPPAPRLEAMLAAPSSATIVIVKINVGRSIGRAKNKSSQLKKLGMQKRQHPIIGSTDRRIASCTSLVWLTTRHSVRLALASRKHDPKRYIGRFRIP